MALELMSFKDFTFPYNPKEYQVSFKRSLVEHKVPMGAYVLQSTGRGCRVLSGSGCFAGPLAYDQFKKLATVFYEETPGMLFHPVWQTAECWFAELELKQNPTPDYVAYRFVFYESYPATPIVRQVTDGTVSAEKKGVSCYSVVKGDSLMEIARRFGKTLQWILDNNPQIVNPNLLCPGDKVRVS